MARRKTTINVNQFSGGLVTEANPLAFPENAAVDILNCDVLPTAEVIRRLGVDHESGWSLSTDTITDSQLTTYAISTHTWKSVAGSGGRQFLAVQQGNMVYFHDQSETVLSDGKKSFSIDLDSYLSPAATDSSTFKIQGTSGRGFFFIVSEAVTPLQVEYDADGDSITVTEIDFEVRDFTGVDDGLEIDEEPTSLSTTHKYNLKNQGWEAASYDPIALFKTDSGVYPSNVQVPWAAVKTGASVIGRVNAKEIRNRGNFTTEAAKGRFKLNPFYRDRSAVSGVSGLDVVTTDSRPSTIAFFSGRLAYAGLTDGVHAGDVFISQVLKSDANNAGAIFQAGDPASEDDSALVATDGVIVPIPEAGNIVALESMGTALLVLASNGAWAITGADGGGFKATGFQVNKIGGVEAGCVSRDAVIVIDDGPAWWGKTGIYGSQIDDVSLLPVMQSLTDPTIRTFYQNIDDLDKANAVGAYDEVSKKAFWIYRDRDSATAGTSEYHCEKVLVFNRLAGAFFPYDITPLASETPYLSSVYTVPQVATVLNSEDVTDGGVTVTDSAVDVTVNVEGSIASSVLTGFLQMSPVPSTTNNAYTFGQFLNTSFVDWEEADSTGINYDSYLEVGYNTLGEAAKDKSAPYLVTFFRRTETGFVADPGGDGYLFSNPSGCNVVAKWEWTDLDASGRWTDAAQVYRQPRDWVVDEGTLTYDNGHPVNTSKVQIPGNGKALAIRYESEDGKDFQLLGWTLDYEGNTSV